MRDPGNAGTLVRSAAAAGVDVVVFGPGSVDPFNDKVVRGGMGAHFRAPLRILANWADIRGTLGADLPIYLAEAGAGLAYDQMDWRRPAALMLGGEAAGASAEARRGAIPLHIPMHRNVESLNVGVAGSIILFEAARQRRRRIISAEVVDRAIGALYDGRQKALRKPQIDFVLCRGQRRLWSNHSGGTCWRASSWASCISTLWEWLYFRRKRLVLTDRRIAELEAALRTASRAQQERSLESAEAWPASSYRSPDVFLESEAPQPIEPMAGS